jgi:pSer/pThr/pTyr-binding forkhead associated (FHA) protein
MILKTDNLAEAITAGLPIQYDPELSPAPPGEMEILNEGISFYIMRVAREMIIHGSENFFIGRSIEPIPAKPMLNLENLDGLGTISSVSRRHAMVCPTENGYEIVDLFSRNGTWIDDQRLLPNKPYPLPSGSLLRIGQERLLVRYHSK